VALVLRGAYHIYYGPGVIGILVWAALFYWIFLRFRQLVPLMVCHVLWDTVAFTSRASSAVAVVGMLAVVALWITCGILWLVERGDRKSGPPTRGYQPWPGHPGAAAYRDAASYPGGASYGSAPPTPRAPQPVAAAEVGGAHPAPNYGFTTPQ